MSATQRSTSRRFRANVWLHRWSSLIATPFFLILCITGTVLIFQEEIDAAFGYTPSAGGAAAGDRRHRRKVSTRSSR